MASETQTPSVQYGQQLTPLRGGAATGTAANLRLQLKDAEEKSEVARTESSGKNDIYALHTKRYFRLGPTKCFI